MCIYNIYQFSNIYLFKYLSGEVLFSYVTCKIEPKLSFNLKFHENEEWYTFWVFLHDLKVSKRRLNQKKPQLSSFICYGDMAGGNLAP